MAFVDLQPPSNSDRISISQHKKSGRVTVTLSGECAVRNKINKATRLRVQIDMEGPRRQLRLIVDKEGAFKVSGRLGNAVSISLPKLPKLPPLGEKTACEWDEGRGQIDIELPKVWQASQGTVVAVAGDPGSPALAPRQYIRK